MGGHDQSDFLFAINSNGMLLQGACLSSVVTVVVCALPVVADGK